MFWGYDCEFVYRPIRFLSHTLVVYIMLVKIPPTGNRPNICHPWDPDSSSYLSSGCLYSTWCLLTMIGRCLPPHPYSRYLEGRHHSLFLEWNVRPPKRWPAAGVNKRKDASKDGLHMGDGVEEENRRTRGHQEPTFTHGHWPSTSHLKWRESPSILGVRGGGTELCTQDEREVHPVLPASSSPSRLEGQGVCGAVFPAVLQVAAWPSCQRKRSSWISVKLPDSGLFSGHLVPWEW
jgi:hypothetical protein